MATITFAERIALDAGQVLSSDKLARWSNLDEPPPYTHDTVRTASVARQAAAWVEAYLGPVGSFDDTNMAIGDVIAAEFGLRRFIFLYSQMYSLTFTDQGFSMLNNLSTEIEAERERRVRRLAMPVVVSTDNSFINVRRPHNQWDSE